MENQKVSCVETRSVNHSPNGDFAPGNKAAVGHTKSGWQPYGQRAVALGEKYTQAEIVEFGRNEQLRIDSLSYWDAVCIVHMARLIDKNLTMTDSGADQLGREREKMVDRIEGTAVQTIRTGAIAPIDPEEADGLSDEQKQRAYDNLIKS